MAGGYLSTAGSAANLTKAELLASSQQLEKLHNNLFYGADGTGVAISSDQLQLYMQARRGRCHAAWFCAFCSDGETGSPSPLLLPRGT